MQTFGAVTLLLNLVGGFKVRNISDKKDAVNIIYKCALMYERNLAEKCLIFVTDSNESTADFEARFKRNNFKHLTGSAVANIDPEVFYNRALENRLQLNDILLSSDGTSSRKLSVLPKLVCIHNTARMVGDYCGARVVVDKYAGTTASAMGFIAVNNIYIPITALKENLSNIVKKTSRNRIVAIFTKSANDALYTHITYRAHNVPLEYIASRKHLTGKVDFNNLIFPDNWTLNQAF